MRLSLFLVLAVTAGCSASPQMPRSERLSVSEFDRLLSQCSRSSVAGAANPWRLSPSQGRAVDRAVEGLASEPTWHGAVPPARYYRQYLGITVSGRPVVYINAFHPDVLKVQAAVAQQSTRSWRSRAMTVCDGGSWFWGAVFDPATRQISQVEFNGQ